MIIIQAIGGLGNQMFQYALYRMFKEQGKKVKMDISSYKTYERTDYELEKVFDLNIDYATIDEVVDAIREKVIYDKEEVNFLFQKEILELDDGYFIGYWQNENYFKSIKPILLNEFKFKIDDEKNIQMLNDIENSESVSILVRRSDYTQIDSVKDIGTLQYFNNAINIIKEKVKNPKFFISTDDLEWTKKNLNIKNSVILTLNTGRTTIYKDMFLMSKCKYNITPNSTFSWWAAFLNKNNNKIVIKPNLWFRYRDGGVATFPVESKQWISCSTGVENDKFIESNKHKQHTVISLDKCCSTRDKAIFEFLCMLFAEKRYEDIKLLSSKKYNNKVLKKYVYYFIFRTNIIKDNYLIIKKNYELFINSIDNNEKNDLELLGMAKYHLAVYLYTTKEYKVSQKLFEEVNMIYKGKHQKAKEYLENMNY